MSQLVTWQHPGYGAITYEDRRAPQPDSAPDSEPPRFKDVRTGEVLTIASVAGHKRATQPPACSWALRLLRREPISPTPRQPDTS